MQTWLRQDLHDAQGFSPLDPRAVSVAMQTWLRQDLHDAQATVQSSVYPLTDPLHSLSAD